jgi:hypothetical protein
MEIEASVGLRAMQVDSYRGDGDVGENQRDDDITPPRQRDQPVSEEGKGIE